MRDFVETVLRYHRESGRHDHPWRITRDPYAILVSEVMLQQTQVSRVLPKYLAWLERFPTADALAAAPLAEVLEAWQGLGYNRRALALKRAAEEISTHHDGIVPRDEASLLGLPGIGPATAAGVRAFAFDEPGVYLETNVRAAFLHHFFADADGVPDREIVPLMHEALAVAAEAGSGSRAWYYALLDYGAHLKRTLRNPSRRSRHHQRQSPFEGSKRQLRARLLRAVMGDAGQSADEYAIAVSADMHRSAEVLDELAEEGFLTRDPEGHYRVTG